MFTCVLIANRGAIAVRIIRTLKKMGIRAVVVYAEADRHSLHVRQADEAFSLGKGNVRETYLDQEKLLSIAAQCGAEAIHPGYGFLSENAEFVTRCHQHGIVFLGPTTQQMAAFGLKHRARQLAQDNDVPLLPGSGLLQDSQQALSVAEEIGYPVMLKSTAGGGGIGMQRCDNPQALDEAFSRVKRLAGNNFSDDGVFVEKFIASARHIEVQIFGDGQGQVIALGERDCSAQRRNQKVIEETPAPNLPAHIRASLAKTAITLCQAVNYRSAGTVEYVYDVSTEQFYFLEVNTRLQVEHGVTEMVYGIDIVRWMIELGAGVLPTLSSLTVGDPNGHAIQVRLYAEDPARNFHPCAGLLSHVQFPTSAPSAQLRIDSWIDSGSEVSPFYDPMLAKVIVHGTDRTQSLHNLKQVLDCTVLYGIETNRDYLRHLLEEPVVSKGVVTTSTLSHIHYQPATFDVVSPGTLTTIQDATCRKGYWHVGIPPSGPFDSRSFRLGNRLLGNSLDASGLEITLNGPTLRFNHSCSIVVSGAEIDVKIDNQPIPMWAVCQINAGQTLSLGKVIGKGCRSYLLIAGGIDCPEYLGSRSTFTLGKFGGHAGRQLRYGDVLHLAAPSTVSAKHLPQALQPDWLDVMSLRVIYGPQGAPDFFTPDDIQQFFDAEWQIHYNSSRTGIRLIGPKPQWARNDGGEAGMHPSNIHDNAYAFGTVDFTGDMPVILGPDGPSLGGFVCPATVIQADLWKLGQLKSGDKIRFIPISLDEADTLSESAENIFSTLHPATNSFSERTDNTALQSPQLWGRPQQQDLPSVNCLAAGDCFILVEYGEQKLDIALRFRVHALMQWLEKNPLPGMMELTPGIRSLQIHFDPQRCPRSTVISHIQKAETFLGNLQNAEVPSRTVWLPLSWDDDACREAVQKYTQSVRPGAPWCPDNIEFIRRINGLDDINEVKEIVFNARYLVMGLGDVYLGAPVATPLDPRHRLVTTKYNPARTWTAENSVGIGGAYLCVYGMEGPGGYQFVGRTLQMWNRDRRTEVFTQPWLLRFFDQIRFYPVTSEELTAIRETFPYGDYPLRIEEGFFNLETYLSEIAAEQPQIDNFTQQRQFAFDQELERWRSEGQFTFDSSLQAVTTEEEQIIPEGCYGLDSQITGSVWKWEVAVGESVEQGQLVGILESMKMEISIHSPVKGEVKALIRQAGDQVLAGQTMMIIAIQNE
ncbi:urea carboxylase [Rosenbergiella australiborealis]|uniref:urea carboxylase n=1 Tax=Rosenbergiella australiborealis TaxID=1544696 RepID=UPI001F4E8A88|nr:urea carboxylase [Rosenbergiella australiborealis]